MNKLFNGQTTTQIAKYIAIGVVNNLSSFFIYLVVTHFGGSPNLTSAVLYGVVSVMSFFGNRQLTFNHAGRLSSSGFRFVIIYGIGFIIMQLSLIVFYQWLNVSHQIVALVATCVLLPYMFYSLKYYVFPEHPSD